MSQIPVTLSIILEKDPVLASLAEFQQAMQATVNEMNSQQVSIPLNINQDTLAVQLTEVREMMAAQPPIAIPAMLDTSGFQAQMDFVRETIAAQAPIEIPVKMVNQGGDGAAGAAATAGGGAMRLFRQLMLLDAAWHVGEAAWDAGTGVGANLATAHNEAEFEAYGHIAEKSRKDSLHDLSSIPLVGGIASGAANILDRGYSAADNLIHGRGFESNSSIIERTEGDTKAIEEHTKKIHEEAEARAKIIEGLNKETERYSLESKNDRTPGSFEREINTIDSQRMDVMQEYRYAGPMAANAKNFDAHGNLLPEAVRTRDAAMSELDAREDKDRGDLNYRLGDDAARNLIAQDELSGDGAKARKDAFNFRIRKEREAAHKSGHDDEAYFNKYTAPMEQREFEVDEKHRGIGMADESRYTIAESHARVDEIRASMNHDPMAEAQAKNEVIDANVRKLQDAAANEIDQEKQKQLAIQATEAARVAEAEKTLNLARAKEEAADKEIEFQRRLNNELFSASQTQERSHGRGYTADKERAAQEYKNRIDEINENKEHLTPQKQQQDRDAAKAERDASLDSIEQGRQREMRGIGERTNEYEWQSKNRPRMAELSRIESELGEQLRQHEDDPAMQWELRQEGAAQLTAFAHPHEQSEWYSSAGDYAKALNTDVLNQDQGASKAATEAAKELKEAARDWKEVLHDAQRITVIGNTSP